MIFSGLYPSPRENLEGTLENLNALFKYSLPRLQAVKQPKAVWVLDTNRNS